MKTKEIAKTVLTEHKTKDIKEEKKKIKELISKITELIKKNKVQAKVKLGGSAAKETYTGNDFDVDIFIMFRYNTYKEEDLSKHLAKILKPLKPVKVHGSRDYFQINKRYEIIPVLEIKKAEQVINVTDASTLHVDWVKKQLKKKASLKDEIKLSKLFFKGIGVYGAESYIKGISGHVTDILTIHYGSFEKMIKAIAKWKNETEIDFEKHKTVIDKAKLTGPLTIVDPIQPNRNAAAAVNQEKYDLLKKKAKEYVKKPSLSFFKVKVVNEKDLKKTYNVILKVKPKSGKVDIVGSKLLKGFEQVSQSLEQFGITKSDWYWDKQETCYYYFKIKHKELAPQFEQIGPNKSFSDHAKRFKQKYKNAKLKKDVWYATVKRKHTKPEQIIKEKIKDKYLLSRVKSIAILK